MKAIRHRTALNPDGCQHCGISRRAHARQWKPPAGWHQWTPPTQAQILARMLVRRATRPTRPVTAQDRLRAVHAAAYPAPDYPRCATCHRDDCPRYRRIQDRLDRQALARLTGLPDTTNGEAPW